MTSSGEQTRSGKPNGGFQPTIQHTIKLQYQESNLGRTENRDQSDMEKTVRSEEGEDTGGEWVSGFYTHASAYSAAFEYGTV